MKKLFENVEGNNFKLSSEGATNDFPDKNDAVAQYLTMIAEMPTDTVPPLEFWKLVVENAETALMKYKTQRAGLNQ